MSTGPVWYVAYGSNTLAARFRCYIEGGRAVGSRRPNPGARDHTPPSGDRVASLPHPVRFGGHSPTWDGGPAFLDVGADGSAVGRAWRVTHGQLEDVLAQENSLAPGSVTIDATTLDSGGVVAAARYGRLVALPRIDDEPAATITCVDIPDHRPPDPRYLSLVRAGLAELGLSTEDVAAALPVHQDG